MTGTYFKKLETGKVSQLRMNSGQVVQHIKNSCQHAISTHLEILLATAHCIIKRIWTTLHACGKNENTDCPWQFDPLGVTALKTNYTQRAQNTSAIQYKQ